MRRAPLALIVLGIAALIASSVAVLVACGPFLTDLIAVNNREPAFREAYSRGDLGVVKPRFYPRYLLQAYRVFNGRAAVRGGALRPWEGRGPVLSKLPGEDWAALVEKLQGPLTPDGGRPRSAGPSYRAGRECHWHRRSRSRSARYAAVRGPV